MTKKEYATLVALLKKLASEEKDAAAWLGEDRKLTELLLLALESAGYTLEAHQKGIHGTILTMAPIYI